VLTLRETRGSSLRALDAADAAKYEPAAASVRSGAVAQ
jgi:hypothetical protein